MSVLTELIYLLRQLTGLTWAMHHLIAGVQELFKSLGKLFALRRWSQKEPLPDLKALPKPDAGSPRNFQGKVSHSYRTDSKNRQLQSELLTLLRNDTATAKRLLKQQRQQHPGKSDNWYLEKVIYDLERDRRC